MRSEDVAAIFQALNDANARYLIVGGIGVNAHGYACATVHADIVLELEHSNVLRAMNALEAIGYRPLAPVKAQDFADPAKRQNWIAEKT